MNADDRLDGRIRAALEWQAERDSRRAPSLSQSARTVASRLGPEPLAVRPTVSFQPTSGRSLQLVLTVLLLLALAAALVALGAQLLRPPIAPFQPVPFGFGTPCDVPVRDGIVYSVIPSFDEPPTILYADGRLVRFPTPTFGTQLGMMDTQVVQVRRLNQRGIDLLKQRIDDAEVTGCRYLRSEVGSGQLTIHGPDGIATLYMHPANGDSVFLRAATPQEEATAVELAEALVNPHTWLPADAWTDSVERDLAPERWMVVVDMSPTGFGPGDGVPLSDGSVLMGEDPRYRDIRMPDGIDPADFGESIPSPDGGGMSRCGVVDTADARILAASLDALGLEPGGDELFTEDLSMRVSIQVVTTLPDEPDCDAHGKGRVQQPTSPPSSTPRPGDDLAGVDPCDLVPPSVDAMLPGVDKRGERPSSLPLGAPARTCTLLRTGGEFSGEIRIAALTLYPKRVERESAPGLAISILGGEPVEETVAGWPTWSNQCLSGALVCGGALVSWADGYLIVFEFDVNRANQEPAGAPEPGITPAIAQAVVSAVLDHLATGPSPGS
jgi:hypothetical protein